MYRNSVFFVWLQDTWTTAQGCSFSSGITSGWHQYIYYGATTWPLMESAGAAFFPAVGNPSGRQYQQYKLPWFLLAVLYLCQRNANDIKFGNNYVYNEPQNNGSRYNGRSVRLAFCRISCRIV